MAGRIALEDFDGRAAAPDTGPVEAGPAPEVPAGTPVESPPPEPQPDPEAERANALGRIARGLETVAAEQAGLRARCTDQVAAALGAAAALLLPALARAGFAALVAETAKTAARHGRWPELVVTLAPEAASMVAGCLAGSAEAPHIRIAPVPGMPADEAAIAWDGGGAELDAAAITESVLAEYRRRLDSPAQTGA